MRFKHHETKQTIQKLHKKRYTISH